MKLVLDCSCGRRRLLDDEIASSVVTCECGQRLTAPSGVELGALPVRPEPLADGEICLIRWPSLYRIVMTDLWVLSYYITIVMVLLYLISIAVFHYDPMVRGNKNIPLQDQSRRTRRQINVVLIVAAFSPLAIWRGLYVKRLIERGILCRARFLKRGIGRGSMVRMDIAYNHDGRHFEKAMTTFGSICDRAERDGSIDILIDPNKPSRYILAPHDSSPR